MGIFPLTFAGRRVCRELTRLAMDSPEQVERARQAATVTPQPAQRLSVPAATHQGSDRWRAQRHQPQAIAKAVVKAPAAPLLVDAQHDGVDRELAVAN